MAKLVLWDTHFLCEPGSKEEAKHCVAQLCLLEHCFEKVSIAQMYSRVLSQIELLHKHVRPCSATMLLKPWLKLGFLGTSMLGP